MSQGICVLLYSNVLRGGLYFNFANILGDCHSYLHKTSFTVMTKRITVTIKINVTMLFIHAEHVVHRRGYCFHFGCMYVCMYVSALERKRLIGMS